MIIDNLINKVYPRRDRRHIVVGKTLANEIRKAQELMSKLNYKRTGKRVMVNGLKASDFVADVFRKERYKLQRK